MLSPSAIAEETDVTAAKPGLATRNHGLSKQPHLFDRPHSHAGLGHPSPRQPAVDRKPPKRLDAPGKRAAVGSPGTLGVSESVMICNDSDLHDLALPEKDITESDTDADEDGEKAGKPGVLGMLYQYSKAQTEKGTGVKI
ncbi:autophagy protein atg9 [Friedmanniomyces endolithicus]|uniref:Autophagy protein atg9 n=1 Tax=Rachicladosporium monterosium TaxID=1507873 RepID=A0ABR0LEW0_9PEZI|nr:autophagy protein atg9 [Friedmanniomyces endolithicus]KAK1055841.1 autophagy protein atg9 [Friedmanniomyces endolithicus]KAK1092690.1 autophagy protein atg9 [Friedmanniomyces endolithicus]KAK1807636.1 autophagy protein atg9 [Friedmanniomyces endolithicus]KAK5147788.1 autophagy protein atg9 [Rachicladosporium monterosium]